MPSLNLSTAPATIRYSEADLRAILKVNAILTHMIAYDPAVKQDATSAMTYLIHVSEHITKQRNPPAEK